MALKKDSNSLDSEKGNSQNENTSLIDLKNLDNQKEIESKPLEVSKGTHNENGFLDFGFNQSILNSLRNKGYKNPTPHLSGIPFLYHFYSLLEDLLSLRFLYQYQVTY